MKKYILYSFKLLFAFFLLYISSVFINKNGMLIYVISVLFLWAPLFFNRAIRYSLLKEINLIAYDKNGLYYRFFSGKTFGYITIIILSLFFAFIIPVRIFLFSSAEFISIIVIFPLIIFSRFIASKFIPKIYVNKFAAYKIESFSYILTSILFAILSPLIAHLLKDINIKIPLLDNNIMDLKENYIAYAIGSVLVFIDNITNTILYSDYTEGLSFKEFSIFIITLGSGGIIFYWIANYVSFFFTKKENLIKVFMPLDSNNEKEIGVNKFLAGFIITLLVIFIYPAIVASLSVISMTNMGYVNKTIEANTKAVEIINNIMYEAGTLEEIEVVKKISYGASKEEVISSINDGYDKLVTNVDLYLDWYYSLPAEYSRLLKLISGKLEKYMADTLQEKLLQNVSFEVDANLIDKNIEKLQKQIDFILEKNRISNTATGDYRVINSLNVNSVYDLGNVEPLIHTKNRLLAATSGALTTGAIVGTIVSKVVSKAFFKATAKVLAKASVSKAASIVAGTIIGTAASIFTSPAGGIAIGTATGIAIDKGLLSLEEAVNREKYKQEIVSSIEESRKNSIAIIENAFKNQ